MRNVSVKLSEDDFRLLDGMARENHKSKAEVVREALQSKAAYEEYKRRAIAEGIKSADNEPLTSHDDAIDEFSAFRREYKERHG